MFGSIAWDEVVLFTINPLELIVRGTLMYLGTFVLLRVVMRREMGGLSVSDLIVVVFIADAAQNGMAGEYKSAADGLLLVTVLIVWAFVIDRLAYHVPWFERLVKPAPVQVVRDGGLLRKNMRREALTEAELMSTMREQGVADISDVKSAWVESDGTISVIQRPGKR